MCGRKGRSLGKYVRLTAWERMTGKHMRTNVTLTVSQNVSRLLYFTLVTISFADNILKESKFNKAHRYSMLDKEDTPDRCLHARRKKNGRRKPYFYQ